MPIKSDAQRRAVAKYNAANYDRLELRVKKGMKEIIQNHAVTRGMSVNEFVNDAISEKIAREAAE